MSTFDLSVLFFLQLAVMLAVCRVSGWIFRHVGQPQVVSEMIAGVALGPSLLGWLAPGVSAALFPAESKPILFAVCQLGLVLYMFLIGVEFDFELIRSRVRSAAAVSLTGIAAPFALGMVIAWHLAGDTTLFSARTTPMQAMLFMGAAMSIQVCAVFGAFLAGLAMPRGRFAQELHRHLYGLTTALLLPTFFIYSGLNTRIGLVDTPQLWALAGVILVAAILGKGVACYGAARLSGEPHRESPAIVTTLMASPIFRWLYGPPSAPQYAAP